MCVPVKSACLLQHLKHVFLENIQSPVAASVHVHPYDIKVKWWLLRRGWIHSRNLSQRVAVASALFILVAQHWHKQVPDQLSHQQSHSRRPGVLASLLMLACLQQHPVQHQSVPVDQRLRLIVYAGVVEHENKVLNQGVNILETASRHMTSQALHVDGPLDGGVVVRQLGTRWQTEEDGAQTPTSAISEVSHSIIELVQPLLEGREVFGLLWRNTTLS